MTADDAVTDLRLTRAAAEVPIPLGDTDVVHAWGLAEDDNVDRESPRPTARPVGASRANQHQAAAEAMAENPTFTWENASTIIGAAIGTYCPEYKGY